MATTKPFGLPPEDAINWFELKGFEVGFDWRDVWREQHAWSFTVAKAMQAEILADIREAVDQAIKDGLTFGEFQKRLRPLLQEKGWWGEKDEVDPATGEVKRVRVGSPRRLRVIYDTNLRQAHAAGRWRRIERLAERRPFLRYIARSPGKNRRAEHQAWHNTVRPVTDPVWKTIAPMNGWGCQCKLQQLGAREVERLGLKVSAPRDLEYRDWLNKRTGEVLRVPVGIDPGFDYNPGLAARSFTPPVALVALDDSGDFAEPELKVAPRGLLPVRTPGDRGRLAKDFAKLFGVPIGHAGRATDPTGVVVEFSAELLPRVEDRAMWLPAAKMAVEDPTEVWLTPYRRKDGGVVVRRRYFWLGRAPDDGRVLLTVDAGGWFEASSGADFQRERRGYRMFPTGS